MSTPPEDDHTSIEFARRLVYSTGRGLGCTPEQIKMVLSQFVQEQRSFAHRGIRPTTDWMQQRIEALLRNAQRLDEYDRAVTGGRQAHRGRRNAPRSWEDSGQDGALGLAEATRRGVPQDKLTQGAKRIGRNRSIDEHRKWSRRTAIPLGDIGDRAAEHPFAVDQHDEPDDAYHRFQEVLDRVDGTPHQTTVAELIERQEREAQGHTEPKSPRLRKRLSRMRQFLMNG
jgi:DNA-directed RNA polymerase specialized sigma24 family protein